MYVVTWYKLWVERRLVIDGKLTIFRQLMKIHSPPYMETHFTMSTALAQHT